MAVHQQPMVKASGTLLQLIERGVGRAVVAMCEASECPQLQSFRQCQFLKAPTKISKAEDVGKFHRQVLGHTATSCYGTPRHESWPTRNCPFVCPEPFPDPPRLSSSVVLNILQYKVLLFNDNGNTREYVSRSLVQVVGLPEDVAYQIMQQVT